MIKFKLLLIFTIFGQQLIAQEEPDIANYMFYHPLVNSAANGSYTELSGIVYGRKQWYSIEGAPANIGLQVVKPHKNNSFGFSLMQETVGVHSKQTAFFTYTHRIKIFWDKNLAFGLSPGFEIVSSNFNKIETTSGIDNEFNGSKTILRPDFNFGVYYYTSDYFVGFSIPSLIKNSIQVSPNDLSGTSSIAPEYWHYYLLGGYNFELNDYYLLQTSTLVKKYIGAPASIDINLNLEYNSLVGAGVSYRSSKEMLLLTNIRISNSIKLGYCYHIYFEIENQILSGHELFISYNYLRSKQTTIQSPRF